MLLVARNAGPLIKPAVGSGTRTLQEVIVERIAADASFIVRVGDSFETNISGSVSSAKSKALLSSRLSKAIVPT